MSLKQTEQELTTVIDLLLKQRNLNMRGLNLRVVSPGVISIKHPFLAPTTFLYVSEKAARYGSKCKYVIHGGDNEDFPIINQTPLTTIVNFLAKVCGKDGCDAFKFLGLALKLTK